MNHSAAGSNRPPRAEPASAPIVVRRPKLDLANRRVPGAPPIDRYWWGGDPFRTHFMNALSSTFPFGEAFFVRSVRHYADRVEDPALTARIRDFAAQEGQHSHLHDDHVTLLTRQGYGVLERRNRILDRVVRWHNRRTPRFSLAMTAAIEHLTALLARQVLREDADWLDDMEPRMRALWRWHALEEAEHKSVAFDVARAAELPHALMVFTMVIATLDLANEVCQRIAYCLWKDGRLFEGRTWSRGLRFLFGRGGFLRGLGAQYRAWFRRDFHPDEIDDSDRIARSSARIELELGRLAIGR